MKVYCYRYDRSENGMMDPILSRLKIRDWLASCWQDAYVVLIPGDRREAVRFAMDVFEAGKPIWHLGAGDECEGDAYHYDGTHRNIITQLANKSGGRGLALHHDVPPQLDVVGPTMTDDLPNTDNDPHPENPYCLLCMNPEVWNYGFEIHQLSDIKTYWAFPGNDGNWSDCVMKLVNGGPGFQAIPSFDRKTFLTYMRHAKFVYGNSSSLCYEAPLWHPDDEIRLVGHRNKGRKIVRWNRKKYGCPSDNVMRLLEKM